MEKKSPAQKAWETMRNKGPGKKAVYTKKRKEGARKAVAKVKNKQWELEKVEYLKVGGHRGQVYAFDKLKLCRYTPPFLLFLYSYLIVPNTFD